MNYEVRYYSQTGNSKKLALAIAEELGIEAKDVKEPLKEHVDLLFLCNSVYWAGADKRVKAFVKDNAAKIGAVVNVSTAAMIESTYKQMKDVCKEAGVALCEKEFHCPGQFTALHKGRPNHEDIENVKTFARSLAKQ